VKKIYSYKKFNIYKQKKEIFFVKDLYEKILNEIFPELNKACDLKFSKRSWRIFIGPWLYRFITVSIDRLNNINFKKNLQKKFVKKNLITKNFSEFISNSQDINWNYYLYYRLKKSNKSIQKNEKKIIRHSFNLFKLIFFYINNFIIKYLLFILGIFNKTLFYKPYLGKSFKTLNFFLRLREVPLIYPIYDDEDYNYQYNWSLRKKIQLSKHYYSSEERLIKKILVESIPTFYIEGVPFLKKKLKESSFPKKIKTIFTSSLLNDNLFKYLCAHYVNKGVKLIIKQHGSNYGQLEMNDVEEHEIKISDNFVTYGWRDNDKKIVTGCNFQNFSRKKFKESNSKKILIILGDTRYFKRNNRVFDDNLSHELSCLKKIDINYKKINHEFFYKIHPLDYKRINLKKKFNNKNLKNLKIISNETRLKDVYKNFKLVIFLYNSTEILNLMRKNLPFFVCFNKNFFNTLNPGAKKIFMKLKKQKVFFDDINKVLDHIKNIENLKNWWNSKKVQESRNIFCENYVNLNQKNFENVVRLIKNTSK
jgi:putative transferase (TIGR04331 family)